MINFAYQMVSGAIIVEWLFLPEKKLLDLKTMSYNQYQIHAFGIYLFYNGSLQLCVLSDTSIFP